MRVCLKIINIRKKEKRERSVNTRASLSLSKSEKIFLLSVGEKK
jgi:flagellar biogenesis protein FliO